MSHVGKIINKDGSYTSTKAGQVFKYLDERMMRMSDGERDWMASPWFDGWTLTIDCKTSSISTRISEIRQQLPGGDLYDGSSRLARYRIEPIQTDDGWSYRLARELQPEQLALV